MNVNPLVSVVVPVYNGEKTLKYCLNSILDQTYNNYEVIIVNNNSTDKTSKIIKEFGKKSGKINSFFENQKGRGSARLKGELKSKGELILMTDSDCIVPRNWISEMIKPIQTKKYDAVQGSEKTNTQNFWGIYTDKESIKNMSENTENAIGKIDTKNFAILKKSLKKIGFTNKKYKTGNDTELSIRFQQNNLKLFFNPNIKVKHFHPDSFIKTIKKYFRSGAGCVIITKDYREYLKKTNFIKKTNQTSMSFLKIFPGLFKTFFLKGPRKAYFDCVIGLSWRAGLIKENLSYKTNLKSLLKLKNN